MPPPPPTRCRRTFLASVGAALAGVAGCTGGTGGGPSETPMPPSTTPAPRRSPTATRTASPTPTDRPTESPTPTPSTGDAAIDRLETELASAEFDGEYLDTHAHWQSPRSPVAAEYAARMADYDIGATVLFSPSRAAERDYAGFLQSLTDPGATYLPFMSAPPPGRDLPAELGSLYEDTGPAFWGIGEWKPQGSPVRDFDGPQLSRLWELAAAIDVPVMYHPFPEQEGQVESALADHPDTTFLLHGHQMLGYGQDRPGLGPTLPRLLGEYDNLYWTMDVATMTDGSLVRFDSAQHFLEWYDANATDAAEVFGDILARLLDAGPTQVVWGTDVAWGWNLTEDVFSRVMEFTETVLDHVPKQHRDPYRAQNARALFGV